MGALDLIVGGVRARLMKRRSTSGSRPNADEITENVWVGGVNSPELVAKQDFGVVIDLRETADSRYVDFLKAHGIEYVNFKIPDRYGASPEALSQIVALIGEEVGKGKKVLVHCNLGRGRSALAVAAYLVSQGLLPEDAMKKIRGRRNVAYMNGRQRRSLSNYASALSASSRKNP